MSINTPKEKQLFNIDSLELPKTLNESNAMLNRAQSQRNREMIKKVCCIALIALGALATSIAIGATILFGPSKARTGGAIVGGALVCIGQGILTFSPPLIDLANKKIAKLKTHIKAFVDTEKAERNKMIQLIETLYKKARQGESFPLDSNNKTYLESQPRFKKLRNKIKSAANPAYPSETVRKIKELASCPELIEARKALELGVKPQPLTEGVSGSYILLGRKKQKLGIFKPRNQELGAAGNPKGYNKPQGLFGITPGTGYLRERVAYLLDKQDHFAGVPLTKITQLASKYFPRHRTAPVSDTLVGSFQKWVSNAHVAYNDYQILPSFLSSVSGHKIPAEQIHKIAIFDLRTLNCDRHLQNFLVSEDLQNTYPIDHGYICPGNATSLRFDWINFAQAKVPFSRDTLNYIEQLDPKADTALVKKKIPNVSTDTLRMLDISIRLIKIAAKKGLTAYQMADLFMRRQHEGLLSILNHFLPLPSKTPSYFEKNIWKKIKSNPFQNLEAFLEKEIDQYLSTS